MRGHDSLDHLRRVFAVLALAILTTGVHRSVPASGPSPPPDGGHAETLSRLAA